MRYTFAVITQVSVYPSNHALMDTDIWIDGQFTPDGKAVCLTGELEAGGDLRQQQERLALWISLRTPVFSVGEILILGPDGREIGSPGRKPSKWGVTCEHFDDLDTAVARALEVMDAC